MKALLLQVGPWDEPVVSDSVVQASGLCSQDGPVAPRDVVETHGVLHQSSIQCQEDVPQLIGIAMAGDMIAQCAPFPTVLVCHLKLRIAHQTQQGKFKQLIGRRNGTVGIVWA